MFQDKPQKHSVPSAFPSANNGFQVMGVFDDCAAAFAVRIISGINFILFFKGNLSSHYDHL